MDDASLRLLGALLLDYAANHTSLPRLLDAVVLVPTSREREESRGGSIPLLLAATIRDQLCATTSPGDRAGVTASRSHAGARRCTAEGATGHLARNPGSGARASDGALGRRYPQNRNNYVCGR